MEKNYLKARHGMTEEEFQYWNDLQSELLDGVSR